MIHIFQSALCVEMCPGSVVCGKDTVIGRPALVMEVGSKEDI